MSITPNNDIIEDEIIDEGRSGEGQPDENKNNDKEIENKENKDSENQEIDEGEIEISDELIERAKDLGISDFALSKFDNENELQRYIDIREDEIIETGRRAFSNKNDSDDEIPESKRDNDVSNKDNKSSEIFQIDYEDPESVHDDVKKNIEGMNKFYSSTINSLKQELDALKGLTPIVNGVQRDIEMREYDKFDSLISSLPAEYKEFVGDGALEDIKDNKEIKAVRDAIWDEKESLKLGYRHTGVKPPSDKVLFKKAVDIVLADKKESIIKKDIKNKAVARQKSFINRPTNRDSKQTLTPEEIAAKNFDARAEKYKGGSRVA